ncbi:BSD domain-containing protein [Heracleum sosnowskyi]|uniref:BSD domain-containing protein n=1 Tax=Heracleum sosnowskyi TaxID=360622 RepID=A0AAD8IM56_9APIA|nr:BSD domain-containing protein [Heracleum sosnowskyi]
MDFFKSVFSDDPEDSNPQTTPPQPPISQPGSNPNPNSDPTREISAVTNAWSFGSTLLRSIATKSESIVDTYRRDLEEFSSGLKKETEVIRKAASKAVKDLPGTFEAGAAVAQEKLESVGQVIDDFTEIIVRNKDILDFGDHGDGYDSGFGESSGNVGGNVGVKAYSRVDALVRGVECDLNTYIREVEDVEEFEEWKRGFVLEERAEEVLEMVEGNGVIKEIFDEVVPGKVEEEVFWERLFFRVWKVRKVEEARSRMVRRAISGEDEEEELSWDVDEEEFEECEERTLKRGDVVEGKGGRLEGFGEDSGVEAEVEGNDEVRGSEGGVEEGGSEKIGAGGEKEVAVRTDEKVTSEGKMDSDISVISSQLSPEEDLGWDEIEDIGSGDEHKVSADGSPNKADLRKRLSAAAADEEEDLTWDIEDDDEHVKS